MNDWNDYRYILALYRFGTLAKAGESLGKNRLTVSRRIDRIEAELGEKLFYTHGKRYSPYPACTSLYNAAVKVEEALKNQTISDVGLEGDFVIHSLAFIVNFFIFRKIKALKDASPRLNISIRASHRKVDLREGGPEISLRIEQPLETHLSRVLITNCPFGLYRTQGSTTKRWIGLTEEYDHLPEMKMAFDFFKIPPDVRINDYPTIAKMAADHRVSCVLPRCMSHNFSYHRPFGSINSVVNRQLWCVYDTQKASDPRIKLAVRWAKENLGNPRSCLCGECKI